MKKKKYGRLLAGGILSLGYYGKASADVVL